MLKLIFKTNRKVILIVIILLQLIGICGFTCKKISEMNENIVKDDTYFSDIIKIIPLSTNRDYNINNVEFTLKSINNINVNVGSYNYEYYCSTFSEIHFKNCETTQNDYRIIRNPVFNIKIHNEDYLLFSFEWENDNILTVVYQLKNGTLVNVWSMSGYLYENDSNKFKIKTLLSTYGNCEFDYFYVISNYEITKDKILQIGDYIINGDSVLIGENMPANIYNIKDSKFVESEVEKGERITFTHTDFVNKLWFVSDGKKEGYVDIELDGDLGQDILLGIYVNGKCIVDYFQQRINNMNEWNKSDAERMKMMKELIEKLNNNVKK